MCLGLPLQVFPLLSLSNWLTLARFVLHFVRQADVSRRISFVARHHYCQQKLKVGQENPLRWSCFAAEMERLLSRRSIALCVPTKNCDARNFVADYICIGDNNYAADGGYNLWTDFASFSCSKSHYVGYCAIRNAGSEKTACILVILSPRPEQRKHNAQTAIKRTMYSCHHTY